MDAACGLGMISAGEGPEASLGPRHIATPPPPPPRPLEQPLLERHGSADRHSDLVACSLEVQADHPRCKRTLLQAEGQYRCKLTRGIS